MEVTVNRDFESYRWTAPNEQTILLGKTVFLNFSGDWTIEVGYILNGVLCYKEMTLYVYDLSNSSQIKKYFEDQDFWPVTIYRSLPEPGGPTCEGNCPCDMQLGEVGFEPNNLYISLLENFELFEEFIPFQDLA